MLSISEKLKKLMDEGKITTYKLAKETGVSYTGVTKILNEQTKHPQIDSLQKIANYFGKNVNYFTNDHNATDSNTPEWASENDKNDLSELLLKEEEVTYNGVILTDEDKKSVNDMLTGMFWKRLEEQRKNKK